MYNYPLTQTLDMTIQNLGRLVGMGLANTVNMTVPQKIDYIYTMTQRLQYYQLCTASTTTTTTTT
jgi:hypothetical protein